MQPDILLVGNYAEIARDNSLISVSATPRSCWSTPATVLPIDTIVGLIVKNLGPQVHAPVAGSIPNPPYELITTIS